MDTTLFYTESRRCELKEHSVRNKTLTSYLLTNPPTYDPGTNFHGSKSPCSMRTLNIKVTFRETPQLSKVLQFIKVPFAETPHLSKVLHFIKVPFAKTPHLSKVLQFIKIPFCGDSTSLKCSPVY